MTAASAWLRPSTGLLLLALACAGPTEDGGTSFRGTTVLAHDDGRSDSRLTFPDSQHEVLIRFSAIPQADDQVRIWWRAASPGRILLVVYGNSALDGPGEILHSGERAVPPDLVSDGKDGKWMVEDVPAIGDAPEGIWVGFRQRDGQASLWASDQDRGQYYVRKHRDGGAAGLLPVRRSPLVRVQFSPGGESRPQP